MNDQNENKGGHLENAPASLPLGGSTSEQQPATPGPYSNPDKKDSSEERGIIGNTPGVNTDRDQLPLAKQTPAGMIEGDVSAGSPVDDANGGAVEEPRDVSHPVHTVIREKADEEKEHDTSEGKPRSGGAAPQSGTNAEA